MKLYLLYVFVVWFISTSCGRIVVFQTFSSSSCQGSVRKPEYVPIVGIRLNHMLRDAEQWADYKGTVIAVNDTMVTSRLADMSIDYTPINGQCITHPIFNTGRFALLPDTVTEAIVSLQRVKTSSVSSGRWDDPYNTNCVTPSFTWLPYIYYPINEQVTAADANYHFFTQQRTTGEEIVTCNFNAAQPSTHTKECTDFTNPLFPAGATEQGSSCYCLRDGDCNMPDFTPIFPHEPFIKINGVTETVRIIRSNQLGPVQTITQTTVQAPTLVTTSSGPSPPTRNSAQQFVYSIGLLCLCTVLL